MRLLQQGVTQAESSVSAPSMEARWERPLYLPRERKCSKFSGAHVKGSLSLEGWVEEVEACIRGRHMSPVDKALFVYDHLDGEARNEIRYRPSTVREDPNEIFKALREVYGRSQSFVTLQQKFFDRKQREGESLQEFSHALMALMDQILQVRPLGVPRPQDVLRDQFCENVRDQALRRELMRLVRQDGGLSLLDVRREAIRWVEEGQPARERYTRHAVQSCEAQVTASSEAVVAKLSDLTELKALVLKQQAQLDQLLKATHSANHFIPTYGQESKWQKGGNQYKRTPDGQPICLKCNQPGHIARYCKRTHPPQASYYQSTVNSSQSCYRQPQVNFLQAEFDHDFNQTSPSYSQVNGGHSNMTQVTQNSQSEN